MVNIQFEQITAHIEHCFHIVYLWCIKIINIQRLQTAAAMEHPSHCCYICRIKMWDINLCNLFAFRKHTLHCCRFWCLRWCLVLVFSFFLYSFSFLQKKDRRGFLRSWCEVIFIFIAYFSLLFFTSRDNPSAITQTSAAGSLFWILLRTLFFSAGGRWGGQDFGNMYQSWLVRLLLVYKILSLKNYHYIIF